MMVLQGKSVCGGVAAGEIRFFPRGGAAVSCTSISDPDAEILRFRQAKQTAAEQLDRLYEKALAEMGSTIAQIFEIHKMMIDDDDYVSSVEGIISENSVNAEYAVSLTSDNFSAMLAEINDEYMSSRSADVRDVSDRIIKILTENQTDNAIKCESGQYIICADDLTPSEMIMLDKGCIKAFAAAYGSINSHTAILARNMNIPAVMGLGDGLLNAANSGKSAIVDGYNGCFVIEPDGNAVKAAEKSMREAQRSREQLYRLRGKDNITVDGRRVQLLANISKAEDISAVLDNDAGGIGLFRTEFICCGNDFMSEDEQFEIYRHVLKRMEGRDVAVRTFDNAAHSDSFSGTENSALGFRAVRLSLAERDEFTTQLRALYRASVYGNLSIIFPMITHAAEVMKIREIIDSIKASLDNEGIAYGNVRTGIMIETPAAAVISDLLAPMVDFFSIGTNDLIQYTCAVDRHNPCMDSFFEQADEAVFRLIKLACDNGHRCGIPVGICGEMGANTAYTERFLRMGIDALSVSAMQILDLRSRVRTLNLSMPSRV